MFKINDKVVCIALIHEIPVSNRVVGFTGEIRGRCVCAFNTDGDIWIVNNEKNWQGHFHTSELALVAKPADKQLEESGFEAKALANWIKS